MKELVELKNGIPTGNSKVVAERFGKTHRHVLEAIRKLECSDEFRESNFRLSSYVSPQNKVLPCYEMTKDGFMFLGMGFSGKPASEMKEVFIKAFNHAIKFVQNESTDLSLPEAINIACLKLDEIKASGSAWGKFGAEIRRNKKQATEEIFHLLDRAQLQLGFEL